MVLTSGSKTVKTTAKADGSRPKAKRGHAWWIASEGGIETAHQFPLDVIRSKTAELTEKGWR